MRSSGKDFRLIANSSRSSFGGESNTSKPVVNRLPKQRPNLIGANKPHMLKNQNDQLRQMLGTKPESKPLLEPIDQSKIKSLRGNSVRASQSSLKSSRNVIGGTPSLRASEKADSIGGTPGKKSNHGKTSGMGTRASGKSVQKFGN